MITKDNHNDMEYNIKSISDRFLNMRFKSRSGCVDIEYQQDLKDNYFK